jgi:hypothetical protein
MGEAVGEWGALGHVDEEEMEGAVWQGARGGVALVRAAGGPNRATRYRCKRHGQGRVWYGGGIRRVVVVGLVAGPVWEGGGRTKPKMNSTIFYLFKSFPKRLQLIQSKVVLPMYQIFQIKYGCVDDLMGNKFPHRSFSNFRTEFKLKNREPI